MRRKKEHIERRQGIIDQDNKRQTRVNRLNSAGRTFRGSENSSRYINTDHKRNQIATHGSQANAQAYNLNKNQQKMSINKKSRPKTAGRMAPQPQYYNNQMEVVNQYGQPEMMLD